jgi:HlyD family secretion protein
VAAQHERVLARARLVTPLTANTEASAIVVRSPINGVLVRRYLESEAVVPAGAPLVELGNPHDIEIVADVLSNEAVKVAAGQRVLIERWGGEHPLDGRVQRVEPAGFMKVSALGIEEQRVNIIIDLDQHRAAAKALGAGYRVDVRVIVWEAADVVKAPISSLVRRGANWQVFVMNGHRVHAREVRIGRRNETEAEVVAGLNPGERVILHPSDAVVDGGRVDPRKI